MLARVNLIPQKPFADRLKILVPLLLLVGVALVIILISFRHRLLTAELARSTQEAEALALIQSRATAEMSSLQQLATELEKLHKQEGTLRAEVAKIEASRGEKKSYSLALATIAASLPGSLRCEKITFKRELGIIEGVASSYHDLPPLIEKLRHSPTFKDAYLSGVDKVEGNTAEPLNFRIQVELQ